MDKIPGSISKWKPDVKTFTKPVPTTVRQQTLIKTFISDEKEILQKMNSGWKLYMLIRVPVQYWLSLNDGSHNPNVTNAAFSHLKEMGAIKEDQVLHPYGTWKLTKHGLKVLAQLSRPKIEPVKHRVFLPEETSVIPPTEDKMAEHLQQDSLVEQANLIRLKDGRYLLTLELTEFTSVLKVAGMLHVKPDEILKTGIVETKVKKEKKGTGKQYFLTNPTDLECDYCHETYHAIKPRTDAWRRTCKKTECMRANERERYTFKIVYGRNATPADKHLH